MADQTENPKVPSLDPGVALPKIVRVTAITLLIYGVAMLSLGVYFPIWAYKNTRGYDFSNINMRIPFYILIGLIIILISFGLIKGGYEMLHRRAYGAGVGIAATVCSFFPALFFIYATVPVSNEDWGRGDETRKFLAMFLFLLLNVIFLYALSKASKILKGEGTKLPKIVRVTAITLLAYSLAMFSLGFFFPIWQYEAARGSSSNYFGVWPYVLVGLIIIRISFSLFMGGYEMLHQRAYGVGVGIAATMLSFFPAGLFIYDMVPVSNKDWMGGVETIKFLAVFLFLLLNVIFLYGLSKADKVLKGVG